MAGPVADASAIEGIETLDARVFAVGILAPAAGRFMLWRAGPSLELYLRSDLRVDALM